MTRSARGARNVWRQLRPELAHELNDARLQFHHAAQLVSAMGISYLPAQPDDSHTNMEWLADLSALASNTVEGTAPVRLAVCPHPFTLLLIESGKPRASLPLSGSTVDEAVGWIRRQLGQRGFHTDAYTLAKHFTIPTHRVGESAPFEVTNTTAFEELESWYADAAMVLEEVVAATPNSSPVRCWPHHFDIATLIDVAGAETGSRRKTISLGMEPGDAYYAQPYFYASMSPAPTAPDAWPVLDGSGVWHTHEWVGAVLLADRLGREEQRAQIESFISTAVEASRRLMLGA